MVQVYVKPSACCTHIVPNHPSHLVVLENGTGPVVDQRELAREVVLLEHLLVGHEKDQLELHQHRVQELRVASVKGLAPSSAAVDHALVLAARHLDGKRPAKKLSAHHVGSA